MAICGFFVALVLGAVFPAQAAGSGGRVGGSSFSSSSYSSPSYSSSSYSSGRSYSSSSSYDYSPSFYNSGDVYDDSGASVLGYLIMMVLLMGLLIAMSSACVRAETRVPKVQMGLRGSTKALKHDLDALAAKADTSTPQGLHQPLQDKRYFSTLAKVRVGLRGPTEALKRDLDALAARADTSSSRGLHKVLQESVALLLRNPGSYAYGTSTSSQLVPKEAEGAFSRMSLEERSKFREETLSNVMGRTLRHQFSNTQDGVDEIIVVTLLVVVKGRVTLPPIRTSADAKACLATLRGVGGTELAAVEVLWTPQAANDYYTVKELLADYPDMAVL